MIRADRAAPGPSSTAAAQRGVAACTVLLALLATQVPSVPELVHLVGTAFDRASASHTPGHQLDRMLSLVSGVVIWGIAAWLTVIVTAAIAAALLSDGPQQRAMAIISLLAPPVLRGVIITALGIGAVAGISGCAPADGADPGGYSTTAGTISPSVADFTTRAGQLDLDLDWPTSDGPANPAQPTIVTTPPPTESAAQATPAEPSVTMDMDWPATAPNSTPEAATPTTADRSTVENPGAVRESESAPENTAENMVIVKPGDSLWSIAGAALGPGASAADIDAGWHQWYEANRALIGADPDRILPGWQLNAPAAIHPDAG